MNISIIKPPRNITLAIETTMDELEKLYNGLGATCVSGRIKDNMTKEQAELWGTFYYKLSDAMDDVL